MGHVSTILAAILCATAPLTGIEIQKPTAEQSQSKIQLGKETISVVRAAYERGDYNEFLTAADVSYQQALSNNELDALIQMRQKEIPAGFHEKWEKRLSDLQSERNQKLLQLINDKDGSTTAEKVRSIAANISTPEQEKAISKLHSFIAMAPKTGANEDENTLIDIDLEFEQKLLTASPAASQEQLLALRMQKMDKMVAASKNFQDHALKQAVGLASANLDARLARNLDGADLNALVKGKAKPSNPLEEQVFELLSSYQGQFSDLMKEIHNANQ